MCLCTVKNTFFFLIIIFLKDQERLLYCLSSGKMNKGRLLVREFRLRTEIWRTQKMFHFPFKITKVFVLSLIAFVCPFVKNKRALGKENDG